MKHFGGRISLLRERNRYTQEGVAAQLGISRAALSHYETNRREPDYDTLQRFADFYDVSLDYLMGRPPRKGEQQHIHSFEKSLELSDERILQEFTLTVDGRVLTREEATRFIAMIRRERRKQRG